MLQALQSTPVDRHFTFNQRSVYDYMKLMRVNNNDGKIFLGQVVRVV